MKPVHEENPNKMKKPDVIAATFSIKFLKIIGDRNGGFNNVIHAKAYDFIFNFERNKSKQIESDPVFF